MLITDWLSQLRFYVPLNTNRSFRRCSVSQSLKTKPNTTRAHIHQSTELYNNTKLEMWANAQRDGRPAEYRWRPLFNAAKFGWCPLLQCRAVMLPRCETSGNLHGCPKLLDRSQLLVGRSSPYCGDMWRRYCCLTSFFFNCWYVP